MEQRELVELLQEESNCVSVSIISWVENAIKVSTQKCHRRRCFFDTPVHWHGCNPPVLRRRARVWLRPGAPAGELLQHI